MYSKNDELKNRLNRFFKTDNFTLQALNGGASVRHYYMLSFPGKSYFPIPSIVLMTLPLGRLETLDDYLNISYYLRRHGVPRPRVYEIQRDDGWIFLEPARGERLDMLLQNCSPDRMKNLYSRVVDFLVNLQQKAVYEAHCPAFNRYFDAEKYLFEFHFHVKEQLFKSYYSFTLSPSEAKIFQTFAETISRFLDARIPVFVHRDFQSSNIFFRSRSKNLALQIIDFQDARSGPLVYDLVSLLWDSYVKVPEEIRQSMLQKFYRDQPLVRQHFDEAGYQKTVDYTIIQRKLHDAGAFIYTFRLTRNSHYLQYIDEAVDIALNSMKKYPEFRDMCEILEKTRRK
ncbi:MAG: DUF1679 domain-containing protein [Calditrichaeota bacterium]|nr:phosphotransferase [Calditrichota bacterium]RQW04849.1 MAG: DUF1679 domain-containing protein [Calditrichota bacterium]